MVLTAPWDIPVSDLERSHERVCPHFRILWLKFQWNTCYSPEKIPLQLQQVCPYLHGLFCYLKTINNFVKISSRKVTGVCLPTRTLKTLGLAYSSTSLSQCGRQSKLGCEETSYTRMSAWADR